MTTETLMTEAATTTEGAASQVAATAPAEGSTAPVTAETAPQQATEGQTSTEAKSGDESSKTEGEQAKPEAKPGAPENYEFAMPEGVQMDEAGIKAFAEFAKDLDLPQEAAQKMLDKLGPAMAQRQADAVEAVRTEWANSAKTDKEFGGDKLNENLAVAKKALDQFGSPELRTLLNESGLGNHPEIIRMMYRAGKAISEDRFVAGGIGGPSAGRDAAKALYPTQQS